jgi:hypothetical protein
MGMLRLAGLLILIVAVAVIVIRNDRQVLEVYPPSAPFPRLAAVLIDRWVVPFQSMVQPYFRLRYDFVAALIVTTAGLGLASIRRPFVRPGKKWPGRGVAAIVVGTLASVWVAVAILPGAIADPTLRYLGFADPQLLFNVLRGCESRSKDAILGAWTLLALAGRWKSEMDGFERCGRILGWCWLGTIAFDWIDASLW